ncbi:MAG: hypothetical protein TR69_WS6001000394 [candidate division WS6 bacterium OLB20]|uniref:Histidine phosphatase superfamily (Branch 1) n=1 Tax=candidate division WS6 bacterium OLB20 TaxID=1617426 RepID=A0A136LXK8_9BACT|nr:MAG: hypothetical protein TR69_WS6001000394 [candidate division WS6 bacterium OLB20]
MELTAVISVIRHGEKNAGGDLTETGADQAQERGRAITHLKGDVILMHSGVGRVKDSISAAARYLHLSADDPREVLEEEAQLQEYVSRYLHYLYDPQSKGSFFSSWDMPDMSDADRNQRMQDFLDLHDTSPEPDIFPSPVGMAKCAARVILTEIDFALLTESRYRTNFINGTHEPVLMSLIAYLFNGFAKAPADYIERIGGSVGYAEGIDILVYQDDTAAEIRCSFRDSSLAIDYQALSEFVRS